MIREKNLEVIVRDFDGGWSTKIWIINRSFDGVRSATVKNGMLEMTKIEEGKEPPPTLELNMDIWRELKRVLIDNKVREKNEVEAELIATKYHLEDMRTLLKIKPKK